MQEHATRIQSCTASDGHLQSADAEARAWELLLRVEALKNSSAIEDVDRWMKEAEDTLKISPPTEFALVSAAAHALSHENFSKTETAPLIDKEALRDSSSLEQATANSTQNDRGRPLVISLASCLDMDGSQPNRMSGCESRVGNQLLPRTAALKAGQICERYMLVIDSAEHRFSNISFHSNHSEEASAGEHDKSECFSDTGGMCRNGVSAIHANPHIRNGVESAGVIAAQILQRYQHTIVARDTASEKAELSTPSENCKGTSRSSHDRSKQAHIDAGSGGTAGSSVSGMGRGAGRGAKLVGGSGGTYSSDGTSDGDSTQSRSPIGLTGIDKYSLEIARSTTPWTYSFFFEDEDYIDEL